MSTQPVEIDILLHDKASSALSAIGASVDASGQDIESLLATISSLETQLDALRNTPTIDLDQSANIAQIAKLERTIAELQAKMQKQTPMPQMPAPNTAPVDRAAKSVGSLNFSIQQLAREMPALAAGPQMFFLAISNNLPIFADELKRARLEYQALKAAGQQAQPVWKQVISSLVSWQTALTVGVTLLVMYGKEIGSWIGSLFGADKALRELEETKKRNLEIDRSATEESARYRQQVIQSINEIRRFNGTKEEERQLTDKLNSQYGETYGYMSTLSGWYSTLTEKAEQYTRVLFLQHKQQKLIDDSVKLQGDIEEVKQKDASQVDGAMGFFSKANLYLAQGYQAQNWRLGGKHRIDAQKIIRDHDLENKQRHIDKLQKKLEDINTQLDKLGAEEEKLRDHTGLKNVPVGSLKDINNQIELARKEYELADTRAKRAELQGRITKLEEQRNKLEIKKTKRGDLNKDVSSHQSARAKAIEEGEKLLIDATKTSYDKQRALANLEHKRRLREIDEQEKSLLAKQAKLRNKGVKIPLSADLEIKTQTAQDRLNVGLLYSKELQEINEREAKDTKQRLERLIGPYRTYQQQRIKIEEDYQEALRKMRESGRSDLGNEAEARRVRDEAMEALDHKIAEREVGFKSLMTRISKMGMAQLSRLLSEAETALTIAEDRGSTPEVELASLRAKVKALREQLSAARVEHDLDAKDPIKQWERTHKSLSRVRATLADLVSGMQELDDVSKSALQTALNVADGVLAMMDSIKTLSAESAAEMSALEKSSVILAIISSAYKIISSVINAGAEAERKHQETLQEVQLTRLKYQQEYNKLLAEQNLLYKQGESVFGTEKIAKAIEALKLHQEAIDRYQQALKGDRPKWAGMPGFSKVEFSEAARQYRDSMRYYKDGLGALGSIRVVTGSVTTGWLWWRKTHEVYASLLDVYPKLIDANNQIDRQALRAIIANEKLSKSDKLRLEGLLSTLEQADKAQQEFRNYLRDTFGDLGQNMVSAITTSVREGRDALEIFAQDMGRVFEKLGEQLLYSLFFATAFKQLEQELTEVFQNKDNLSEEALMNRAISRLDSFFLNQKDNIRRGKVFAEEYRRRAADKGYSVFDGSQDQAQNGRAGAFATMTQDQASKLEGMFTAGQVHWANIDASVASLLERANGWGDMLGSIAKNAEYIPLIYNVITLMRSEGIKVK